MIRISIEISDAKHLKISIGSVKNETFGRISVREEIIRIRIRIRIRIEMNDNWRGMDFGTRQLPAYVS